MKQPSKIKNIYPIFFILTIAINLVSGIWIDLPIFNSIWKLLFPGNVLISNIISVLLYIIIPVASFILSILCWMKQKNWLWTLLVILSFILSVYPALIALIGLVNSH